MKDLALPVAVRAGWASARSVKDVPGKRVKDVMGLNIKDGGTRRVNGTSKTNIQKVGPSANVGAGSRKRQVHVADRFVDCVVPDECSGPGPSC